MTKDITEVRTESGTTYEFRSGFVRRVSSTHEMRQDGGWLKVFSMGAPTIGESMVIWLEPLDPEATFTRRITSPVVSMERV